MRVMAALTVAIAAMWSIAFTAAGKIKPLSGHDCGKVRSAGFGGPLPPGVPKNAKPELHAFILRGQISCSKARSVIQTFETSGASGKPTGPAGWSCGFKKSAKRSVCTMGSVTVADGIEFKVPKSGKG